VAAVRANVTIDWTQRESVRAHLCVMVKRILRKHGYPPDKQEKATQTVLEQAEALSELWAAAWEEACAILDGRSSWVRSAQQERGRGSRPWAESLRRCTGVRPIP
jgi:Type I restriction enzyme HindI endonuclease subunit-like, C-terminal